MPGININKKSPPRSIFPESNSNTNNGINMSVSPTKKAFMNALANSLSRSMSMGSFSYKSLGKSLSQMSYGRSPLFDIYQQFKQSVPRNSLPPCIEEDSEMLQDIEANFCKDFTCCGIVLKDLHELLQHFEDAHRMESDMEEEDDLPFEFDDLSSNRNGNENENYLPTLTDLFMKDLESKQRHMEEQSMINNGVPQQSIAMSDIYSEDNKKLDTLAGNNTANNTSFSDILNNKNNLLNSNNSTTSANKLNINSNSNLSSIQTSLSRNNSTSSISSKINNAISLNIPNTTSMASTSSTITTPTSANTSNFNLSKNISAFNKVNSAVSSTSSLFQKSSSQSQTPKLGNASLATTTSLNTTSSLANNNTSTTLANSSAATLAAISAATSASGLKAISSLQSIQQNLQKMQSIQSKTTLQPTTTATPVTSGMHPIFPNTNSLIFPTNGNKGATPFGMIDPTRRNDEQDFDGMDMDMDMDMEENNEMMANNESLLMAEAGPDEDKKYRCTIPGCNKSYKNPGGLKYHLQHGHFEDTGDPEMNKIINKPFQCTYENCGKRYKNMNGLKYHYEHSHMALYFTQQNPNLSGLAGNTQGHNVPTDQVLAFQALQMQQHLQQLQQHIN